MTKYTEEEKKVADDWWHGTLSINEQDSYRLACPFYSNIGLDLFLAMKNGVYEIHEYTMKNKK